MDCTKHAIANANLPANRLSGQACLSVRLSAQVMVPQPGSGAQQPGSGYVLGARLVRARGIQEVKAMLARPPSLQDAVRELQDKVSVWRVVHACTHACNAFCAGLTTHRGACALLDSTSAQQACSSTLAALAITAARELLVPNRTIPSTAVVTLVLRLLPVIASVRVLARFPAAGWRRR